MTLEQFIIKYNGKYVDYDGKYSAQCVDLIRQYIQDVLKKPQLPRTLYAKDIFNNFKSDSNYKKVFNDPKNPNQFPKYGDIVFWGWRWPVTGIAGHVAICTGGNGYKFIAFTQNYPTKSPCRYYNYDYRGVMGWITPLK